MLEAYIDGACAPVNPGGTASYGVIVLKDGKEIWQDYGIIGTGPTMSNNVGEYGALLKLLNWLDNHPVEYVTIYSDSQLIINQMTGKWAIKKGLYRSCAGNCLNWLIQNADMWHSKIKFEWIPRDENIADVLANKAFEQNKERRDTVNKLVKDFREALIKTKKPKEEPKVESKPKDK